MRSGGVNPTIQVRDREAKSSHSLGPPNGPKARRCPLSTLDSTAARAAPHPRHCPAGTELGLSAAAPQTGTPRPQPPRQVRQGGGRRGRRSPGRRLAGSASRLRGIKSYKYSASSGCHVSVPPPSGGGPRGRGRGRQGRGRRRPPGLRLELRRLPQRHCSICEPLVQKRPAIRMEVLFGAAPPSGTQESRPLPPPRPPPPAATGHPALGRRLHSPPPGSPAARPRGAWRRLAGGGGAAAVPKLRLAPLQHHLLGLRRAGWKAGGLAPGRGGADVEARGRRRQPQHCPLLAERRRTPRPARAAGGREPAPPPDARKGGSGARSSPCLLGTCERALSLSPPPPPPPQPRSHQSRLPFPGIVCLRYLQAADQD